MTIGKRIDGRHMYVSVEGRIDTITAPNLERFIMPDIDTEGCRQGEENDSYGLK